VIDADQAGNDNYNDGSASQTIAVSPASTTTTLTVTHSSLSAKVTSATPGPSPVGGTVTFSVDGQTVGTAPVGAGGVATLTYVVPTGKARAVAAAYSGNADYNGSSASAARHDPTITATVTSSASKPKSGWYRASVKVTFHCAATTAPLAVSCPKPVTMSASKAGQSVTRTVTATDGGAATVTKSGINIDRVKPTVSIRGPKAGKTYRGHAPKATCIGHDKLSGIASCRITRHAKGKHVTLTAVAKDQAGNIARRTLKYILI
jgi:hypothetical protein